MPSFIGFAAFARLTFLDRLLRGMVGMLGMLITILQGSAAPKSTPIQIMVVTGKVHNTSEASLHNLSIKLRPNTQPYMRIMVARYCSCVLEPVSRRVNFIRDHNTLTFGLAEVLRLWFQYCH